MIGFECEKRWSSRFLFLEIAKIMQQYSNKNLPICFTSFFTQTRQFIIVPLHSRFETICAYLTFYRLGVKGHLNFPIICHNFCNFKIVQILNF